MINSICVTNDLGKIDAAQLSEQNVRYISRTYVTSMANETRRVEWGVLQKAPTLLVIVNGVQYRRQHLDSPITFDLSALDATSAEGGGARDLLSGTFGRLSSNGTERGIAIDSA